MDQVYMTTERMEAGFARLLSQGLDLEVNGARVVKSSPAKRAAGEPHRKLYTKYRKELQKVMAEAIEWWNGRTEVLTEELGSAKKARLANWKEFPAGPVSDPYTVAVVRKYWLACDGLNDGDAAGLPVAPETFLLQWVIDDGDMKVAEILSGMPYWPMGLDADGNWT